MKLIDPCSQCFVMPMCRDDCINKTKYDQAIDIRRQRKWDIFFLICVVTGLFEGITIVAIWIHKNIGIG